MNEIMRKLELRIYELLGVRVFRILAFKLEKFIHRRDRGRNANYHIAAYDPRSVDGFIKYLFYNGAIHIRNMLFMLVVFFARYLVFETYSAVDILLWVLFLKDCYCVMLQRYNYLRIQIHNEQIKDKHRRRIERKGRQLIDKKSKVLSDSERESCLEFVRIFSNSIVERNCIVIGEKDIQMLLSLKKMISLAETKEKEKD